MKKILTVVLALLCFVNISYFSVKAEENYAEPSVEEVEERINSLQDSIEYNLERIAKAKEQLEILEDSVIFFREKLDEANQQLQRIKNEYNRVRATMLKNKATLDEIVSKFDYATKKLEYLEVARKNAIEKLKERELAAREAQAAYEKAKGTEYEEVARAIFEVRKAEYESALKDVKELEAKLEECKKEINVLYEQKKEAEIAYQDSLSLVNQVEADLNRANDEVDEWKRYIEIADIYSRESISYEIKAYNKYINLLNHELLLADECLEKRKNNEPIYKGYLGYWDALNKQQKAIEKAYEKLVGDHPKELVKLANAEAVNAEAVNAVAGVTFTAVANNVELSDADIIGSAEIYEQVMEAYLDGIASKAQLLYYRSIVLSDLGSYNDALSTQVYLVDTLNGVMKGIIDPTPTPTPKKDESCEKVKGPTWHWNNTKGVCEEVAVVGTSAR